MSTSYTALHYIHCTTYTTLHDAPVPMLLCFPARQFSSRLPQHSTAANPQQRTSPQPRHMVFCADLDVRGPNSPPLVPCPSCRFQSCRLSAADHEPSIARAAAVVSRAAGHTVVISIPMTVFVSARPVPPVLCMFLRGRGSCTS